MSTKQTTHPKVSPLYSLMALALVVTLGCFVEASAQWTTTGNDITNSNSGNVGVGKSSPTHKLDVLSSIGAIARFDSTASAHTQVLINSASGFNVSLALTRAGALKWSLGNIASNDRLVFLNSSSAEVFSVLQTGKVGVGTATPTAQLQIMTASGDGEGLRIHRNGTGVGWGVAQFFTLNNSSSAAIDYAQISGGITSNTAGSETGVLAFYTRASGALNERMRILSSGDVGIGTTTPGTRLEVVGATNWIARFKKTDSSNGGIIVDSATGFNPNLALAVNGANKWHILNNATSSDVLQFWEATGAFPRFTLTQSGSVGIGTNSPSYKLHVQGGSVNASDGLCINGDCKGSWSTVATQWANGSGGSINFGAGLVGIGTTSPLYSLDVNGGTNGFRARSSSTSSNDTVATFENGSAIQMIVRANGNVGIGTTSPTEKLHVSGNVKITGDIDVTGNIKAKYQDLAEWVESSQELAAGTVVILDENRSNQVIASTQSYDSRVAGVISLKPGLELGERGEGRVLVATTGRVKVKVDATGGPIKIGDLLVTSDREGFAMKSSPVDVGGVRIHRPGTLIGKALEPLAGGTGEILVLLSMQ